MPYLNFRIFSQTKICACLRVQPNRSFNVCPKLFQEKRASTQSKLIKSSSQKDPGISLGSKGKKIKIDFQLTIFI